MPRAIWARSGRERFTSRATDPCFHCLVAPRPMLLSVECALAPFRRRRRLRTPVLMASFPLGERGVPTETRPIPPEADVNEQFKAETTTRPLPETTTPATSASPSSLRGEPRHRAEAGPRPSLRVRTAIAAGGATNQFHIRG